MTKNNLNYKQLAISHPNELVFGWAPKPVKCRSGLIIGDGKVYPEINFTLPPMSVDSSSWPTVLQHYEAITEAIVRRAAALSLPGLVVEFEQLPQMTENPQWGAEITAVLHRGLQKLQEDTGIPAALRVTVVDLREKIRPPELRSGVSWERMHEAFILAAQAGADILSIESIGGKEIHDESLLYGDLFGITVSLGILGCRDMAWLWDEISQIAQKYGIISGGDTACGFGNTAMQLAGKKMIPTVLAAIDRAATAPRSLAAYEHGAVGPSKDCAYEGPIMKAITGCPISMEGKSACCAHFSPIGNIAGAMADLWSNESVQNIRLLSGSAPEAFLELLTYDCRLFNQALKDNEALRLRNWLVASDTANSPEAWILEPEVVMAISNAIVKAEGGYLRTVAAVRTACEQINRAVNTKQLRLDEREMQWLTRLSEAAETLPDNEADALAQMSEQHGNLFRRDSYNL